jgi:hypothetical protein
VVRPLFQAVTLGASFFHGSQGSLNRSRVQSDRDEQRDGMFARCREDVIKESVLNTKVNVDLVEGVKDMNVSGKVGDSVTDGSGKKGVKERVSFGINMST